MSNSVYVDFYNKDNNFKLERKYFDTFDLAKKWCLETMDKFDPALVRLVEFEKPLISGFNFLYKTKKK